MREVPTAGDAITKALTTEVSTAQGTVRLALSEAEETKTLPDLAKAGDRIRFIPNIQLPVEEPHEDESKKEQGQNTEYLEIMIRPVLERISGEILRSIKFFTDNTGRRVDAVYLTGGSSNLPALLDQIRKSLAVPVKKIDPFEDLGFLKDEARRLASKHSASLTVAVGLAIAEEHKISLLSKTVRLMRHFAQYAPKVAAALLLLGFVPLLVMGVGKMVEIQQQRPEIRRDSDTLQRARAKQDQLVTLQAQVQRAVEQNRAIQAVLGNDPMWPGILNSIASSVPKDMTLTRLSARHSDPSKSIISISIEGQVHASSGGFDTAMATLLSNLGSSPFFTQVRSTGARLGKAEDVVGVFQVQCNVVY
ncbi:MAG: hypothetical protein C0404_08535 [Verrucomicrobia bacterium]|nr:hypothetical protein [Verrucomicrobiota bacterium]